MMITIYEKTGEEFCEFEDVVEEIRDGVEEVYISRENQRSFRELENVKKSCSQNDIVLVKSLSSLGTNNADILIQLDWFTENKVVLLILDMDSTYKNGILQQVNAMILDIIRQSIANTDKKILSMKSKTNAGRNRLEFPEGWDELYKEWEEKRISSKQFMETAGFKKATFYNMLTEYRSILNEKKECEKKYKNA